MKRFTLGLAFLVSLAFMLVPSPAAASGTSFSGKNSRMSERTPRGSSLMKIESAVNAEFDGGRAHSVVIVADDRPRFERSERVRIDDRHCQ